MFIYCLLNEIEQGIVLIGVENNVIITKDPQYRINKKGIGWECFNYMKKHKGRIAQVYF